MATFSMPEIARRTASKMLYFRSRIPSAVLLALAANPSAAKPRGWGKREVWLSLRTSDPKAAKALYAVELAAFEQYCAALLAAPKPLSQKNVQALAGEVYRAMVAAAEDDPSAFRGWREGRRTVSHEAYPGPWPPRRSFKEAVATYEDAADRNNAVPDRDLGGAERPEHDSGDDDELSLEVTARRQLEADPKARAWFAAAALDRVLAAHRLVVTEADRAKLLDAAFAAELQGLDRVSQMAGGDYSPDPHAARYPTFDGSPLTFEDMIASYETETRNTPKTIDSRSRAVAVLKAFLKHNDPRRVPADDAIRFKEKLIADGYAPKTINDNWLAGLSGVFAVAVANRRLKANPFAGVRQKASTASKKRKEGYRDDEMRKVLKAALALEPLPKGKPTIAAARRWAPWLCAFTGARISEICQLRKQDVQQRQGVWLIHITPAAGSLKRREHERWVPLHSQLVEQGFPAFVAQSPGERLFYDASFPRKKGAKNPPASKVAGRVADWVRSLGVNDPALQPSHGWRHRRATLRRHHRQDPEMHAYMMGQEFEGVMPDYGIHDALDLSREMELLPRIALD